MGRRWDVALLVAIMSSLGPALAQEGLRVGVLLPGTLYGPKGQEIKESIAAMTQEIGARRSLNFYYEEYQNPAEARAKISKLTADGVKIFVGPADSASLSAVRDLIDVQKLLIPIGVNYSFSARTPDGIVPLVAPSGNGEAYPTKPMTKSIFQLLEQSYLELKSTDAEKISKFIKEEQRSFDTAAGKIVSTRGLLFCSHCAIICTLPKVVCKGDSSRCCDP